MPSVALTHLKATDRIKRSQIREIFRFSTAFLGSVRMRTLSRPFVLVGLVSLMASPCLRAQERVQEKESKTIEKEKPAEPTPAAKEESSVTDHTLKIGSQSIPYKATAATILLKNEKDEPTALIYYTAYT